MARTKRKGAADADAGLSAAARKHLRDWKNPGGWWEYGDEGSELRAAQDELIAAGRMRLDEAVPGTVRLIR